MQYIDGVLLHKKSVKTKQGSDLSIVSILNNYDNYSAVVDVADFDNFVNDDLVGKSVLLPVRSRAVVGDNNRAFLNYTTCAKPLSSKGLQQNV